MTSHREGKDMEPFRQMIARRLGLHFDDSKLDFLGQVQRKWMEPGGRSEELELSKLAEELTVPETYFFRHVEQFRVLGEIVLPELLRARDRRQPVRILSAGCSTGEEAYSIAMTVAEHFPGLTRNEIEIKGVDVVPSRIERARLARYPRWSFRATSEEVKAARFHRNGDEFRLIERIRAMADFQVCNLAEPDPSLWEPARFDVVFCRNVLMYFTPERAREVVGRITGALAAGGYLFLGHAETLRGLTDGYHLRHAREAFFYARKKAGHRQPTTCDAPGAREADAREAALDVLRDEDSSWVDLIGRASDRIQSLVERHAAVEDPSPRSRPLPREKETLAFAMELLRSERYQEGLACVAALSAESARDPEALLLRAVLLVHTGDFHEAEETCRRLMSIDELHSGAHYVMALCKEALGDGTKAAEHDRIAADLDPGFAMPRLHLGLLARRSGERAAVRRELGRALALLQRETPSRLLLFGGGFGREALVALCRAGLTASGGQP